MSRKIKFIKALDVKRPIIPGRLIGRNVFFRLRVIMYHQTEVVLIFVVGNHTRLQVGEGKKSYNNRNFATWSHHGHDTSSWFTSRALRNLVRGYECGRVFPAGVGPDSPSREDAANWLPSRFSLSVETRRRYGWLRMVFPGARLFRAPIW